MKKGKQKIKNIFSGTAKKQFCCIKYHIGNDYRRAALQLNNCLDEHSPPHPPVVCVRKYRQAVAAVEVSGGKVLQALGFDDDPLEKEPGLYRAVEKWMARFHLAWDEDRYAHFEDPEEPDLPF